ncbi:hypothetical protein K438DRAFT_1940336 [Mycena galopus ATCC 62051]|nr:hypothetical protein K438DRAFT_1940336 [Mycena galopus ATCC 62051]
MSAASANLDHTVWAIQPDQESAICRICDDGRVRKLHNCNGHERTATHKALLEHHRTQAVMPSPANRIVWGLIGDDEADIPMTAEEQAVAQIASGILQRFDELPGSDDELEERSVASDDHLEEPLVPEIPTSPGENTHQPRKRARTTETDTLSKFWFPWHDRITCTLDILMHLPRSVFSHLNEVDDVPSVKSMQTLNAAIQKMCGIDTIAYNGALGHKYFVNSLAQIIARVGLKSVSKIATSLITVQEMSNPKLRPHLSFYPEDSGPKLSEARQGQCWLNEIPDDQTTPMLRIGADNYFIHEPAMLRDGKFCMPTRWFTKDGQYYANCWEMSSVASDKGSGWRVLLKAQPLVVPASEFLKKFPAFQRDAAHYNIPDPTCIIDVFDEALNTSSKWTHTDPKVGNLWRARAKGHRVVCFPLWVYCDDTSGNVSKKWNEHNSFLATPAGLPRAEAQKEYNIHFLSTSNIAPPLEMLDGIVDQLELSIAQENGVWAWDVVLMEPVLVIPPVLALLGDNPMQSEFACYIGLRGKLFCRACWVKGTDVSDPADPAAPNIAGDSDGESATGSVHSAASSNNSMASDGDQQKGKGKKLKETMAQMVKRVTDFVKIGTLRNKTETTDKLKSFFTEASTLDTKTKIQNQCTEFGLEDTYQLFFLEKLFKSYKGKRGRPSKQAALDAALSRLPENTTSPVWRIKGLDLHQDTPVEILHVVLLGFVKYLWRDLVQVQLKNKDDKKNLHITRLSSISVAGLGISPLAGRTLVQYSSSLTGRDFRSIAQVAPFVVYDLVSADCFTTWQSLSKLIPLIWQPEIEDIESYIMSISLLPLSKTTQFQQIRHGLFGSGVGMVGRCVHIFFLSPPSPFVVASISRQGLHSPNTTPISVLFCETRVGNYNRVEGNSEVTATWNTAWRRRHGPAH